MNSSCSFTQNRSASPHGTGGGRSWPGGFPRDPSVQGGAGGFRVSLSFPRPSCPPRGGSWGSERGGPLLGGNGKETMQNLNDRLASYLDKVRALEAANQKLESRILQWHKERDSGGKKDYSQQEENISHLQEQIVDSKMANAHILVLIDNARMAVDDFNLKYENELSRKKDLEVEVEALRRTLDDLTIVTTDLEQEVEGMRKELILMKKGHEQVVEGHPVPDDFKVSVKVNATPGEDLIKVLEDMRQGYESVMRQKQNDWDSWFREQSAATSHEVPRPAAVQGNQGDVHELKRTLQALEIDLQAQHDRKSALESTLGETQSRYSCQLRDVQLLISCYEKELLQLSHDLERQNSGYQALLGVKTHLEKEIATYRRLLEGDREGAMEESGSGIEESAAPKIKAITQESVNGRIVFSQMNEIQTHA